MILSLADLCEYHLKASLKELILKPFDFQSIPFMPILIKEALPSLHLPR